MKTAKNRLTSRPEEKPAYLEARRTFQQVVHAAKRSAFKKFCSEVSPKDMWKKLNRLSKKSHPQVPDLQGEECLSTTSQEKASILARRFFVSPSDERSDLLSASSSRRNELVCSDIADSEVAWTDVDEVAETIKRTRSFSACGPDGIHNIVLKSVLP